MSITYDCLDNIIGLSRIECTCYDDPPADFDTSLSGIYLDELEPLNVFDALLNCETGTDIWELMDKAREQATIMVRSDISALLMKSYKLRRQPFYGSIGYLKYTDTLSTTANYIMGMRLFCANIVGGVIRLRQIGLFFDTTDDWDVEIWDNVNGLLYSLTLSSVADTHTINSFAEIELPLHSSYTENLEYFIGWKNASSSAKPKNIKVKCDCGKFKANFDVNCPYFWQSHSDKMYGWANYVMIGGFSQAYADFDPQTDDTCTSTTSNYTYGMTLPDIEMKCKVSEVLCDDTRYLDFEANPLAMALAYAVRYKAGELMINLLKLSKNVNFMRLINGEELDAARKEYVSKYNELVGYLVDNVNVATNDCLQCKDLIDIVRTGILA